MKNMTWQNLVMIALAGSAALLAGAFIFQTLGYAPCKLCYWQRYPHAVAIAIGIIALAMKQRFMAWIGAAAALATSGIGVFHSGVERDLWEGPTSCTGGATQGMSSTDLLDQIMSAPLIRCDEISWQMAGLTMANLNAIFSLILAIIWVMAALRKPA